MSARSRYRRGAGVAPAGAVLAVTVLAVAALAAGCAAGEPTADNGGPLPGGPQPTPSAAGPPTDVVSVLATGLQIPWDVAFLPDGAALVTERDTGRLLRVGPESDQDGLRVTEVQTIAGVNPRGEGGLMGIVASPQYETDQTVFIYYTTAQDNRIARLTPGGTPEPILTGIPNGGNHNGGRLAFGPDGYLYATTGEVGDPPLAQDRSTLAGKILRMTTDGRPAPGNPFGDDSLIWAYGLRNVQGLAWDSSDRLWATEFGERTWDELNLIEPGGNYGWPEVEGVGGDDRFIDPVQVWSTSEASCSGLAAVERLLIAACLRGQRLWLLEPTASGGLLGQPTSLLVEEYGRLRTVVPAPDGSLWITTSNHDGRLPGGPHADDDRILRLVPAGGGSGGRS